MNSTAWAVMEYRIQHKSAYYHTIHNIIGIMETQGELKVKTA
jgi:hypothetical protein